MRSRLVELLTSRRFFTQLLGAERRTIAHRSTMRRVGNGKIDDRGVRRFASEETRHGNTATD